LIVSLETITKIAAMGGRWRALAGSVVDDHRKISPPQVKPTTMITSTGITIASSTDLAFRAEAGWFEKLSGCYRVHR
jgi:hypothetical protein